MSVPDTGFDGFPDVLMKVRCRAAKGVLCTIDGVAVRPAGFKS
ncbi:hypothetical protein VHA_002986 [Grimontia hollisae CIP 101886]|uniref:Uncharacterized protein n=1 Tax=Grimontia hollisae CIP 101886 TaxID=675812 RepID=D0IB59_GRIHO|nr:hypothetical protein VHA_002986 [Grimontia hollisae CIP 101886]